MSAASYASTRPLLPQDMHGLFPWIPAGNVLNAGCGDGELAGALGLHGFPVIACDTDRSRLEAACQRHLSPHIQWQHEDLRGVRLQRGTFAAILSLSVLPYIPNGERARLIGRLKAAIKPGGLLILGGRKSGDASEEQKCARSLNQLVEKPTGILQPGELAERLSDWDILFTYEGPWQGRQVSQIVARKPYGPMPAPTWKKLAWLGVGTPWRPHMPTSLARSGHIDFLEVILNRYLEPEEDAHLNHLCRHWQVIPRGLDLSLGSTLPPQEDYLEAVARVLRRCDSPWWIEHAAYTRTPGYEAYSLQPQPLTVEGAEQLIRHLRPLRQLSSTPLLLEYPASMAPVPQTLSLPAFLRKVAEGSDTGLVLDVEALQRDAQHQQTALENWLDELPRERVVQLHLSGNPHQPPAARRALWDLTRILLARFPIKALCLDDHAFDLHEALLPEITHAKRLMGVRMA